MIVDTAGRLQVDEKLMQELEEIKKTAHFQNTLLVVDAMTGQEALNIARAFNEKLELNGFLLSKMDGDARGGAAVSIRAITEKPIMYVGSGEKVEDLEDFHPDRVASKVLCFDPCRKGKQVLALVFRPLVVFPLYLQS